jgi:hypothetical protein
MHHHGINPKSDAQSSYEQIIFINAIMTERFEGRRKEMSPHLVLVAGSNSNHYQQASRAHAIAPVMLLHPSKRKQCA